MYAKLKIYVHLPNIYSFIPFFPIKYLDKFNINLSSLFQMSPLIAAPSPSIAPLTSLGATRGVAARCSSPPTPPQGSQGGLNWSAVCLRPTPPLRPCLALGAAPGGPYQRYNSRRPTTYKEDGLILDVIEAYCSLGKPRSTVNSGMYVMYLLNRLI